jgi:hypothetical protein
MPEDGGASRRFCFPSSNRDGDPAAQGVTYQLRACFRTSYVIYQIFIAKWHLLGISCIHADCRNLRNIHANVVSIPASNAIFLRNPSILSARRVFSTCRPLIYHIPYVNTLHREMRDRKDIAGELQRGRESIQRTDRSAVINMWVDTREYAPGTKK